MMKTIKADILIIATNVDERQKLLWRLNSINIKI